LCYNKEIPLSLGRKNKDTTTFFQGGLFMDNQYIYIGGGRQFRLSTEARESHPELSKAVLSEKFGDEYQKINVWKPGMDTPKVPFSSIHVPEEIFEIFEVYKNRLEAQERKLGIADY
jgi:hypothetical protein